MFQISFNLGQSMSRTLSNMGLERMLYHLPDQRPALEDLAAMSESQLPRLVQECSVAMGYIQLFGALDWKHFPERPDQRIWPDFPPIPFSAFSAACLVKIDRNLVYMSDLRQFLVEHPALLWVSRCSNRGVIRGDLTLTPACPPNAISAACYARCPIRPWNICWIARLSTFRPS
jgi:hypothetical protein